MEQETRINFEIEECIRVLKQLQSKEEVLTAEDDSPPEVKGPNRVQAMRKWVSRSGITLDSIDGLNIIHVSGTKGKGSTCAFCESILRHHGYRTGFFSSPHLVEVRERIRINGQPISKEKFVSYFWDVYNELEATKTVDNNSMPGFFRFMCIMAFHAFQKEQTDVVIMEVGVGGEWDGTNIIRKSSVCGVTSLGIDHINMLGNTIENIAWHKGGIFKHGVPAFTSPQPAEAIKVLQDRAQKIGCNLEVVPPFESYQVPGGKIKLGLAGQMQTVNASLALQITKTWMNSQENCRNSTCNCIVNDSTDLKIANSFPLTPAFINGLVECKWLGRNQQIKRKQLTYYIDGAHTVESIEQCIDWFQEHSKMEAANIRGKVVKILVFSTTGERDSSQLQPPLMKGGFDAVVFCPMILHRGSKPDIAMTKQLLTRESEMKNCQNNMDTWKRMFQAAPMNCVHKKCNQVISDMDHQTKAAQAQHHTDCIGNGVSSDHTANGETLNHAANGFSSDLQSRNISNRQAVDSDSHIIMLPCIYDALLWASHKNDPHLKASFDLPAQIRGADHVQVLITGSLYLVGAAIGILSNSL